MPNSRRSLRFVSLLALLLLLTVFTPRSSATRLLRQTAAAAVTAGPAASVQTITLPAAAMSREAEQVLPADKRVEALLGMKPRGRGPPSAPSKRTNDINS